MEKQYTIPLDAIIVADNPDEIISEIAGKIKKVVLDYMAKEKEIKCSYIDFTIFEKSGIKPKEN